MLSMRLLAVLALPSLVAAGIFPADSLVKMLDHKGFKKAMKANQTSMIAFVAPWCGHCQRMAPEYSKAALGLYPLLPVYAVDCDNSKNKRLCADQGVQGFPTVKLYPRGASAGSMTYEAPERTASGFYYWATRGIPNMNTKLFYVEDIAPWVEKTKDVNSALLLSKDKKVPLLWTVLANKYKGQLQLASHRDRKGRSSVTLGYEEGEKKESKLLIYPAGSTKAYRYEGILKHDSLSKFFDSVIDGSADLTTANEEAKSEEFDLDDEELEIQRKQEAQRIALLHGGYSDLIDFEEALKNGGADYHDTTGYGGMMGAPPVPKKKPETPSPDASTAAETGSEAKHSATSVPTVPHVETQPAAEEQVVLSDKPPGAAGQCGSSHGIVDPPTGDCHPPSHPKDEL